MKKAIAEFIGTFALVFIGCGTVVVGGMATGSTAINELAIALAFGLSIVAMAYGIGQISGCHVNPAVSFGVYTAGRMTLEELLTYWVAQIAGAIAASVASKSSSSTVSDSSNSLLVSCMYAEPRYTSRRGGVRPKVLTWRKVPDTPSLASAACIGSQHTGEINVSIFFIVNSCCCRNERSSCI